MTPPPRDPALSLWRNDITGLRALAVLPVLLYHAFPKTMAGGFFGVDIFFVISGFLISGIIFRGLLANNFSYRIFYAKRIRRIVPNLILLLLFVAVLGWFFLLPTELQNLGRHIYYSAGFAQNFRLLKEIGYFTEDALRIPLLHLWSLAIEEQFYIVFPILCALLWHFKSVKALTIAAIIITVASFLTCLAISDHNFAFYFPLTRFWELGVGITLAALETFKIFEFRRIDKTIRSGLSLAGILMILAAMILYYPALAHPGWITLLPVVGAMFLIAAQPDAVVNRTLLSWRPMTFIGLISYSLYLWHWPLLSFLFICEPQTPTWCLIVALILSFILAATIYRFVEQPMRRTNRFGNRIIIALLLGLLLCFALGKAFQLSKGFPQRSPYFMEVQKVRAINEFAPFNDAPSFIYQGVRVATPTPDKFPSILFAGDSHSVQYYLRAETLSQKTHQSVGFIGTTGCVILSKKGCRKEASAIYAMVRDPRLKTLVIASKWAWYAHDWPDIFADGLSELKAAMAYRPDLKIFILLDYPWTPEETDGRQGNFDPLRHLSRWHEKNNYIVPYPDDKTWKNGNEAVESGLRGLNVTFIRPENYVCPNGLCNLLKWYKDDDHLQPLQLQSDGIWLDPIFE